MQESHLLKNCLFESFFLKSVHLKIVTFIKSFKVDTLEITFSKYDKDVNMST